MIWFSPTCDTKAFHVSVGSKALDGDQERSRADLAQLEQQRDQLELQCTAMGSERFVTVQLIRAFRVTKPHQSSSYNAAAQWQLSEALQVPTLTPPVGREGILQLREHGSLRVV